jgi:hypothetical protein
VAYGIASFDVPMSASRNPVSNIPRGSKMRCLHSSLKSTPLAASATNPASAVARFEYV